MEENNMLDFDMDSILKSAEKIYGIKESNEFLSRYDTFIKLKKAGSINMGNYNVYIQNRSDCGSAEKIVDIICKVLKHNEITDGSYRYLQVNETVYDEKSGTYKKIKKMTEKLIVIDKRRIGLFGFDSMVKDIIDKHPEKIVIVLSDREMQEFIGLNNENLITWNIKISKSSEKDKHDYITNFFKQNKLKFRKCKTIDDLSKESFCRVNDILLNVLVNCKKNNTNSVDTTYIKGKLEKFETNENENKNKSTKALKDLNSMIGMQEVKEQIDQIVNYIKVNKQNKKMPMLHMCFSGNPGTGKTTAARVLGKILKEEQILSKNGKFVEVHGRDLIAQYVGWTAGKVKEKVKEAEGGILFIDEAYSLRPQGSRGFENEAIDTLIKEMEDKRDKLCVILAGYTEDINELLRVNAGFESRIQFKIEFRDYTAEETYEIFKLMAKQDKYKVDKDLKYRVVEYFETQKQKEGFSNGRCARNLFEKIKFEQADRVVKNNEKDINLIKEIDVLKVIEKQTSREEIKPRIGFYMN